MVNCKTRAQIISLGRHGITPLVPLRQELNSVEADTRAQELDAGAAADDVDGKNLPLARALNPGGLGHGVGQLYVVSTVSTDSQRAGAGLSGGGGQGGRPLVDCDGGAAADVRLRDTDANRVSGLELLGGELEVDEVAAVDLLQTGALAHSLDGDIGGELDSRTVLTFHM